MRKALDIEVRAVDNPREAVRGADILSSATDSMEPVYDAEWIEPGHARHQSRPPRDAATRR